MPLYLSTSNLTSVLSSDLEPQIDPAGTPWRISFERRRTQVSLLDGASELPLSWEVELFILEPGALEDIGLGGGGGGVPAEGGGGGVPEEGGGGGAPEEGGGGGGGDR